jgi:hypothetical protein
MAAAPYNTVGRGNRIPNVGRKIPDACLQCSDAPVDSTWPIVFEVGYYQSAASLEAKARMWLGQVPEIEMVITASVRQVFAQNIPDSCAPCPLPSS